MIPPYLLLAILLPATPPTTIHHTPPRGATTMAQPVPPGHGAHPPVYHDPLRRISHAPGTASDRVGRNAKHPNQIADMGRTLTPTEYTDRPKGR